LGSRNFNFFRAYNKIDEKVARTLKKNQIKGPQRAINLKKKTKLLPNVIMEVNMSSMANYFRD
jgi:hypothetical protein